MVTNRFLQICDIMLFPASYTYVECVARHRGRLGAQDILNWDLRRASLAEPAAMVNPEDPAELFQIILPLPL